MNATNIPKNPAWLEFQQERGTAITFYTHVEERLSFLVAELVGAEPDYVGLLFWKLNNARARDAALHRLLRKRHGGTYNLFTNSLESELQKLAARRNEIVHWAIGQRVSSNSMGEPTLSYMLGPPNYFDHDENTPELFVKDFRDFTAKCDFIAKLVKQFHLRLTKPEWITPAWQDIFLQPITYPPPNNHPIFQT